MQLSKYFNLADLTTTSTGYSNTPPSSVLGNLKSLALLLDQIRDQIGPFEINSGYRSSDVNKAVGGSNSSLHLKGQAADLRPTTMSAQEFFKRIAASPLKNKLGEIINESEIGVVHVTTPTWSLQGVLKYMQDGQYYHYTEQQIKNIVGSSVQFAKQNPITTILALSFVAGGIFYFVSRRK